MSALGHKQTYAVQNVMCAVPPKADMSQYTLPLPTLITAHHGPWAPSACPGLKLTDARAAAAAKIVRTSARAKPNICVEVSLGMTSEQFRRDIYGTGASRSSARKIFQLRACANAERAPISTGERYVSGSAAAGNSPGRLKLPAGQWTSRIASSSKYCKAG